MNGGGDKRMKKIIKCGLLFSAVDETVKKDMMIVVENQKIIKVLSQDD